MRRSSVTPVADFNLETRPLLDEQIGARWGAFQQSAARYPNIKPGEEFTGYA